MRSKLHASTAAVALAGAFIGFAAPARAQDGLISPSLDSTAAESSQAVAEAVESANQGGVGDIVVTAQKREQRLNDVPLSISVATGATLQNAGVTEASQLGSVVSGFTSSISVFGPPVFSLRGVNFNSFQASAPPTVSSYIDEAALPYPVMGQALFLDVERVEVLKGPQGTLFGQNATAGSINVIAAKPTRDLAAGFRVDANHWGEVNAEGFVSGPVSDTLRARLALQTTQFGGWQRGYFLNDQKNGDQNKVAGRLLLDWTPTDRLAISVNLNASRDRSEQQQAQAFIITPVNPAAPTAGPFLQYRDHLPNDARDADFDLGYDTRADSRTYQAVLRADYELSDALSLTSLTNFIDTRFRSSHDADGTAIVMQPDLTKADIQSVNQEIRVTGAYPEAGVNFVVGASYGDDDITEGVFADYFGYTGFPPHSASEWKYDLTQRAAAIFGSVDFEIVDKLTLTAGVRYTDTKQTIQGCTYDAGPGGLAATAGFLASFFNPAAAAAYLPGGCITIDDGGSNPTFLPVAADKTQKQDNIAWRGALNYQPTRDILVYGSVSRGYKAGTFPVIINLFDSAVQPVSQEELTAYEVGTKLTLLDRRVQFNASVFHYDYKDKQVFSFLPVFGGLVTTATLINIPKSTVDGFDFEVTAEPIDGLRLTGGATYIKTEVKNFVGFDFQGQPLDFSGGEFNYAPPWSANLDIEYSFETRGGLKPFVGGTITYRDRTFADLGENPDFFMPSYTLFDVRIGIESAAGWRLSLYGRNLTDEYYWNSVASAGDGAVRFTGQPRTFGATFSQRF